MKRAKRRARRADVDLGPLLTVRQAAGRLNRKVTTVRRLIRCKKLQAVLVANTVMVLERSLDEYLRPRPYQPQKPAPACAGWNDKVKPELHEVQGQQADP